MATARLYVPVDDRWRACVSAEDQAYAAYVLNLLHWRWLCWRADDDGFVRLKAEYLKKFIPWAQLKSIREALEAGDVIDWHRSYVPGERSMRYRLRPAFRRSHAVDFEHALLSRKIRQHRNETERALLPVHRWLRSNLTALEFDLPRAESVISGLLPDDGGPLSPDEYRELLLEQTRRLAEQQTGGSPELTVCRFGRVHTAVTRLPRQLRCCLSIAGEPLHSIDLKNSQPLFAGIVATDYHESTRKQRHLKSWTPGRPKQYWRRSSTRRDQGQPLTPCQSGSSIPTGSHAPDRPYYDSSRDSTSFKTGGYDGCLMSSGVRSDLDEYLALCESGQIYESLMQPGEDRSRFKRRLFADVLFGRDRHPSELRREFHERFPSVGEMLTGLKERDYRRPSWLMQWHESSTFIGQICRRLMNEEPGMPLVTIHDSLVTTAEYIDHVHLVAVDEFAALGVHPTFDHEVYSPAGIQFQAVRNKERVGERATAACA